MLKTTFISRASDGLILCETYDTVTDSQGNYFNSLSHLMFGYSWNPKAECQNVIEKNEQARDIMHCQPWGPLLSVTFVK